MWGWLIRTGCGKQTYQPAGTTPRALRLDLVGAPFAFERACMARPRAPKWFSPERRIDVYTTCTRLCTVARRVETARISLECTPGSRYRSKGAARPKKAREDLSFPGFPFLGSLPVHGRPLHDIERPPMTGTSTHGPRPPAQGRDVGWLVSGGAPPLAIAADRLSGGRSEVRAEASGAMSQDCRKISCCVREDCTRTSRWRA